MSEEIRTKEQRFQDQHPELYRYLKLLAEEYGVEGLRQALDEIQEQMP